MTTAASVGWGRLRSRPGHEEQHAATIAAAPTSPVTWVLAPACSATAVREPLVLTGKPWKKPAAMLAAPMPIISRLPSTSCAGARGERRRRRDRVGERHQRDAQRAGDQQPRSRPLDFGTVNGGKPSGSVPTSVTPWSARSNSARGGDREHHRDQHAGDPWAARCKHEDQRQADDADRRGGRRPPRRRPGPRRTPRASSIRPSASTENPNSFGSWPTRIVSARPFM